MIYDVTYQIGGEEQTDRVDAPDAASAASRVRMSHQLDEGQFELILVHLVTDEELDPNAEPACNGAVSASG